LKPNIKIYQWIVIFTATVISITNSFSDQPEKPAALKEFIASLEKPIILRGDYLKAAQVAYQDDFSKIIANRMVGTFFSKLENYDIAIEQQGINFIVSFAPTMRNNAPEIFGGGARYVIDSKTFEIKEKRYTN